MIPNSRQRLNQFVRFLRIAGALIGSLIVVPGSAGAASQTPELVVYFVDADALERSATTLTTAKLPIELETTLTAIRVPLTSADQVGGLLRILETLPGVRAVEHNTPIALAEVDRQLTPNDPQVENQTALSQIGAPAAWELSQGSTHVTMAVLDTGINGAHREFTNRTIAGTNVLTGAAISAGADSDDNGHGTEVAGVAAATGNDGVGIAGVDWNVRLMPVKVLDADGAGLGTDLANGIRYAADHGANVINLSLGGTTDSTAVREAVAYALGKGSLVVAAAGNDGGDSVLYPARYDGVVAVGSVSPRDGHSFFSNHGPELDLVAPGEGILTTRDSATAAEYLTASGTSIAAPFVSGAASLLMARSPNSTMDDVRSALTATAAKPAGMTGQTFTTYYGNGRLDAAALTAALDRYDAAGVSQYLAEHPGRYDVAFGPGETRTVTVTLQNTGSSTWYAGGATPTKLGTAVPRDRSSPFLSSTHAGILQQAEVRPGESGTFQFTLTAPNVQAAYEEKFQVVTEGRAWFGPEVLFRILVARHDATGVTQGPHQGPSDVDLTLAPGQNGTLSLTVRNSGDATWFQGGPYPVRVGPARPIDRTSPFLRSGRAALDQPVVIPGATGTFTIPITAPTAVGIYEEDFQVVVEQVAWIGPIVRWKLRVQ